MPTDHPTAVLPCPWCGKVPALRQWNITQKFFVECRDGACEVQPCTGEHKTTDLAIAAWNTRPEGRP